MITTLDRFVRVGGNNFMCGKFESSVFSCFLVDVTIPLWHGKLCKTVWICGLSDGARVSAGHHSHPGAFAALKKLYILQSIGVTRTLVLRSQRKTQKFNYQLQNNLHFANYPISNLFYLQLYEQNGYGVLLRKLPKNRLFESPHICSMATSIEI